VVSGAGRGLAGATGVAAGVAYGSLVAAEYVAPAFNGALPDGQGENQ
jgi:hypothetical protein